MFWFSLINVDFLPVTLKIITDNNQFQCYQVFRTAMINYINKLHFQFISK